MVGEIKYNELFPQYYGACFDEISPGENFLLYSIWLITLPS